MEIVTQILPVCAGSLPLDFTQQTARKGNRFISVNDVLFLTKTANMCFDRCWRYLNLFSDLIVRETGMDKAEYLPLPAGQWRSSDWFRQVWPVDNILDNRLIQCDAYGATEVTLLLTKLDETFSSLFFHVFYTVLARQGFQYVD